MNSARFHFQKLCVGLVSVMDRHTTINDGIMGGIPSTIFFKIPTPSGTSAQAVGVTRNRLTAPLWGGNFHGVNDR